MSCLVTIYEKQLVPWKKLCLAMEQCRLMTDKFIYSTDPKE